MTRHFSNFKKYSTTASFMGFHFWAKDEAVATRCPLSDCPWIAETADTKWDELIEEIKRHIKWHDEKED